MVIADLKQLIRPARLQRASHHRLLVHLRLSLWSGGGLIRALDGSHNNAETSTPMIKGEDDEPRPKKI